jgi:hypothetical protein
MLDMAFNRWPSGDWERGGQPSEAEAESRAGETDEQIARWIKIQIGG